MLANDIKSLRPNAEMLNWCTSVAKSRMVVLEDGTILSDSATNPNLQNCRLLMKSLNLEIRQIINYDVVFIKNMIDSYQSSIEGKSLYQFTDAQQKIRKIVQDAIAEKATDIHILIRDATAIIKFRVLGDLQVYTTMSANDAIAIVSVAFNRESDHVQKQFSINQIIDAAMVLQIGRQEVRLRLASVPTYPGGKGCDIVMRVLPLRSQAKPIQLEQLGYHQAQLEEFKHVIRKTSGAIFLAGPTGSGKSTTMASLISLLPKNKKIYTAEDPVENLIDGVTQVPVNHEVDYMSFANIVRQFLRLDPDIISIGEIRDSDTAFMALRAAITGHLVISTVHANSATNIIVRLLDLGLSATTLSDPDFLNMLGFQRLIKLLCPHCKIPLAEVNHYTKERERMLQIFGSTDMEKLFVNGNNLGESYHCEYCKNRGTKGLTIVAETLLVDDLVREHIADNQLNRLPSILRAKTGFMTCHQSAAIHILQGNADPFEVESILGPFEIET